MRVFERLRANESTHASCLSPCDSAFASAPFFSASGRLVFIFSSSSPTCAAFAAAAAASAAFFLASSSALRLASSSAFFLAASSAALRLASSSAAFFLAASSAALRFSAKEDFCTCERESDSLWCCAAQICVRKKVKGRTDLPPACVAAPPLPSSCARLPVEENIVIGSLDID